jgi:ubiquinone/menaquinone biosynthesis C-methylase UbiE
MTTLPKDKSLRYYGRIYHEFVDPDMAEARQLVVNLVDKGSSVLDIACGTGQLCFELKADKSCRVVGIDLSLRMLEFAKRSNPFEDVKFIHLDAAELSGIEDGSFDYATILFLVHELHRDKRLSVLKEAFRVARKIIITDQNVPLPKNLYGFEIRFVEFTFGHEHYHHFKEFLASGGIIPMLQSSGIPFTVEHRSKFMHDCREGVMVSKSP